MADSKPADPAEDWVDPIVVERFVGERDKPGRDLTPAEKHAVVTLIVARGGGASDVAKRLGVSGTTARKMIKYIGQGVPIHA